MSAIQGLFIASNYYHQNIERFKDDIFPYANNDVWFIDQLLFHSELVIEINDDYRTHQLVLFVYQAARAHDVLINFHQTLLKTGHLRFSSMLGV